MASSGRLAAAPIPGIVEATGAVVCIADIGVAARTGQVTTGGRIAAAPIIGLFM